MVLSAVDQHVLDCIRAASRRAVVLVLAVAPCRIAPPQQWALLQAGAADVLLWPTLPASADPISARFDRLRRVREISESPRVSAALIGAGAAWSCLLRQVVELALYARGPVLITGESGTGKELVARLIHELDTRQDKRELVVVDCTTITPELSGSEFFGHERGAYTGAMTARDGAFAQAHGGTLFLDEIGDLPMSLQAKLLRFLQERVIERVGGRQEIPVETRVVCATHQALKDHITTGRFREDLFYRLAEIVVEIPPLRARPGDAALLAHAFGRRIAVEQRRGSITLLPDAIAAIEAHAWPGNVRELENVIKRAVIIVDGNTISAADLGLSGAEAESLNLREVREIAERNAVVRVLGRVNGNLTRAAEMLGVSRPTLYDLMHRFGLK
jgi:two-component system NtrC family response regulator